MQLAPHQSVAHVGTVAREQRMSVDLDAIAHIIKPLTDLYSDRILAFVREYSTNAWDSHVRAGVDRPIEVTQPTQDAPYFQVQDFGLGLSADELADLYSVYGKSLNRNSELAAGTFGFGSKSALAYADDFTIIAIKDGVRNVVQVVKDNDGIGVLKFLDQRATAEGNGVTVRVPVQRSDWRDLASKAREFYAYWDQGTVVLDGEVVDSVWSQEANDKRIQIDDDVFVTREPYGSATHRIVMGQVAYPVRENFKGAPQGVGITARVSMGLVTFTPSREALKINETTTLTTLNALGKYVKDMLIVRGTEELDKAPTPWDRFRTWVKLTQTWDMKLGDEFGYHAARQHRQYRHVQAADRKPLGWEYKANQRRTFGLYNVHDPLIRNMRDHSLVVTGVPFQALTPVVKARIAAYCDTNGLDRRALVLAGHPDFMEGHPNLVTYDDLPVIKREKAERAQSQGYTWTVYVNGAPRTYTAHKPSGTKIAFHNYYVPSSLRLLPGVHYAALRANQVEKFKRTFPTARPFHEYWSESAAKVKANIDEAARIYDACQQHFAGFAAALGNGYGIADPDLRKVIADPDLRKVMAVASRGAPESWTQAIEHDMRSELSGFDLAAILSRYPLVTRWSPTLPADDLLLYINSKYNTTNPTTEVTAS